jgi:hypothetical protein
MAAIQKHYDYDHPLYKQFESLMPDHPVIDKWYPINEDSLIYYNAKGFYHIVQYKNSKTHYSFWDYVLTSSMELKFNKEIGYFKTKDEVTEFLKEVTV